MRLTLSLTLVALALSASLASAADWPRYRGPNNDGIAEDAKLEKLSLTPAWKVPVGDSFGQVAIVGGKAFLMAKRGADEVCLCLDAATGKELWATRIDKTITDGNGDGPRSTPSIDGKFVYVLGTYLRLFCLDVDSGKEVWNHNLEKEHGAKILNWGSASSPQVIGDLVLVTGGGEGKGISAFNKTTGQLAWAKTSEEYTHATPTVATIKGKLQAVCLMKSGFVSVDPANGDVLWTFPIPKAASAGAIAASPVVGGKDGDIVYYSIGYNVGAGACRVSNDAGKWAAKELWTTSGTKLQTTWSTAVHRDGYIYGLFGHASDSGPLNCVDIQTGTIKWSQPNFSSQGGLILSGDKLLIQTVKGDLVLVPASPDAFKELARTTVLPGKDWTAPTLANNLLFVRNSSAKTGANTAELACYKIAN